MNDYMNFCGWKEHRPHQNYTSRGKLLGARQTSLAKGRSPPHFTLHFAQVQVFALSEGSARAHTAPAVSARGDREIEKKIDLFLHALP